LRPQDHQRTQPDRRRKIELHDEVDCDWKQQIGWESRQKLRKRLDFFGNRRSQADSDADR
jgi:hypothetical protein